MAPATKRDVATEIITIVSVAFFYRYWLIAPVLRNVTIDKWHVLAISVAGLFGCILALLRLSLPALACGIIMGLFLGGTWAEWKAPNDVSISIEAAFVLHLESFWKEILVLTAAASVSAFSCTHFLKRSFTN